jgi:hypothetical protein
MSLTIINVESTNVLYSHTPLSTLTERHKRLVNMSHILRIKPAGWMDQIYQDWESKLRLDAGPMMTWTRMTVSLVFYF